MILTAVLRTGAECGERDRGVEGIRTGNGEGRAPEPPRHTADQGSRPRSRRRRRRLRSVLPSVSRAPPSMISSAPLAPLKVHTLDIAPLRIVNHHRRSAQVWRVFSRDFTVFTCTPTRSSAIGMSHTCLCLPSYNWYSFTDPGGMEG